MSYLKAVVGALIAGLGTAATAVTDGHITMAEGIAVASTTLIALYGVWQAPNAAAPPAPVPPITTSTSGNVKVVPRDGGAGTPTPPD